MGRFLQWTSSNVTHTLENSNKECKRTELIEADSQLIKTYCSEIIAGTGSVFSWKWDDRFKAALLNFSGSQAPLIRNLLEQRFPPPWNPQTIAGASPVVRDIAESIGSIEPGQELFVAEMSQPVPLVAAWWPWQSGPQISLRLFPWMPEDAGTTFSQEFREWFGV